MPGGDRVEIDDCPTVHDGVPREGGAMIRELDCVALDVDMAIRGAHMVEVGIPYCDPMADGPVIAASYTRALRNGLKLASIFEMIEGLRAGERLDMPIVTMVSYAIVHRHGVTAYLDRAS